MAPPEGGGMGRVADIEARFLNERGMEAWLMAPETGKPLDGPEYVSRMPAIKLGNAARILALDKIVTGADVVHLHYPFYGTAGRVAALKRSGVIKRLVVTLHMDAASSGVRGLIFDLHRKWFQSGILQSADALLVSSRDYAQHSSYKDLSGDERMMELPFGVDSDVFSPGDGNRQAFGIPEGARVVGTVSVMDAAHPFKGVDLLIKALADLPQDAHLLLVGDGDRRAAFEKMAHDLGVGDRTHFAGRLSSEQLVVALRTMDVFAFPSTSRAEAFGLAMLEAMACGVPVVCSDLPGVRIVAQGTGKTFAVNDLSDMSGAITSLLKDENARCNFGHAARAKAMQYSWKNHMDKLVETYEKLCA